MASDEQTRGFRIVDELTKATGSTPLIPVLHAKIKELETRGYVRTHVDVRRNVDGDIVEKEDGVSAVTRYVSLTPKGAWLLT